MNLARSSTAIFTSKVTVTVISFIGLIYFSRKLGAGPMGTYFLFQTLLGLLSIPADLGLRGAVQKRISESNSPEPYFSSALIMKISLVMLISLFIYIFRYSINSYVGAKVAYLIMLGLLLREGAFLTNSILRGELRVSETAILDILRQGIWLAGGAILIALGYGALALIYATLCAFAVFMLYGWYKISLPLKKPSYRHMRSLFQYGKYDTLSSAGGFIFNWIDIAIVGYFLTNSQVGAYSIAWRISSAAVLLSQSIATTIFPQVSNWDGNAEVDRVESLLPKALTGSLLLTIPAFGGILILSPDILDIVFGNEFIQANHALVVLMLLRIVQGFQFVFSYTIKALNRPEYDALAIVSASLINILLNIIFVPFYGITGAAIATTVSLFAALVVHWLGLSQILTVELPLREVGVFSVASTVMISVVYILKNILVLDTTIDLLFVISAGATTYFALILLDPKIRDMATTTKLSLSIRE